MHKKYLLFPLLSAAFAAMSVAAVSLRFALPHPVGVVAASLCGAGAAAFCVASIVCWRKDLAARARLEGELTAMSAEHDRELAAQKDELHSQYSNEIISFHSRVSHGMRIPISIILGYADLLRGGLITDEEAKRQYLEKICEKTGYMNDLLGQMLLEARTTAGVPAIMFQPVDALELVRSVADELASVALKKGVMLRVVSSEERVMISGDVMHLTKAFYNIIENSLKYMGREGTVNITVSCADGSAFIVFKDNGRGISPDEAARVFDKNYQGANRVSGNGLGLYLVREVINAHGGAVHAKSDLGAGMGVYITLPATQEQEQSAEAPPAEDMASRAV